MGCMDVPEHLVNKLRWVVRGVNLSWHNQSEDAARCRDLPRSSLSALVAHGIVDQLRFVITQGFLDLRDDIWGRTINDVSCSE